jgi:hypothetical protein
MGKYDDLFDGGNNASQAGLTLRFGIETNPDEAAKADLLAKRYNLPVGLIKQYKPDYEARAKVEDAMPLLEQSPKLRDWLSQDVNNASMAQTSIQNLSAIEKGFDFAKNLGRASYSSLLSASAGVVNLPRIPLEMANEALGAVNLGKPLTPATTWLEKYQAGIKADADALMPKGEGNIESGIYSGVGSLIRNLAGLPLAFLPGGQGAYLASIVAPMGGEEYGKAREKGLSAVPATQYAATQAGWEYLTERMPAMKFIGDIKAGTPLYKTLVNNLAREIPSEQAATVVQDFTEWATLNPEKPFAEYLKERPDAAAQTLVATIVSSGGQVTLAKTVDAAVRVYDQRLQQSQQSADVVNTITENSATAKLREINPLAYEAVIKKQAEGSGAETLFVDVNQFVDVLKQSGITLDQLNQNMPTVVESAQEALFKGGGDVAIPVEKYATYMAGTDLGTNLAQHVRINDDIDTLSAAEKIIAEQERNEILKQVTETVEEKIVRTKEFDESASKVQARFEQQISGATNIYTPQQLKREAVLMSNMYSVMAERLGILPEQAYEMYPITIGQEGQTVFNQQVEGIPINLETDEQTLNARSDAGYVTADIRNDGVHITNSQVEMESRGQGEGLRLYQAVVDNALNRGLTVYSDATVQPEAARIYEALQRRGYDVKVREGAKTTKLGTVVGKGMTEPAFEITGRSAPGILKQSARVQTGPALFDGITNEMGLTPEEINTTAMQWMTGLPGDMAFLPPYVGGLSEVVAFLHERRLESGLPVLDINKPEDRTELARLMAAEALAHIRNAGNSLEWYDATVAKTVAMMSIKYPELNLDRNARNAFLLSTAIASQGMNVEDNLRFAEEQYEAWRDTGSFPVTGKGESAGAMAANFQKANDLIAEMGQDMFAQFLVTPFTVRELETAGFAVGGENKDTMVLGSAIFGPKIGFGFYSNLNGNFEPVTMDMWFMRTIGRLTGTLPAFDRAKFDKQLDRFRNAFKERGKKEEGLYASQFDRDLVSRARTDEGAAIELARLVKSAHERDYKNNRAAFDAGTRKKSDMVAAAETMIISLDKPRDVPASGGERNNLRDVVSQMVSMVEAQYGQRVPPAALQALIWYPEQELYKAMGVKLRVTSQDYAGAARKLLLAEGINEQQLDIAAELGSRLVRSRDGQTIAEAVQGNDQRAGRASPFQADERTQFIIDRNRKIIEEQQAAAARVNFEVAPDPNNAELVNRWRELSQEDRLQVSLEVAREVVPKVLKQLKFKGEILPQVGSYLDDTNPSFALRLDKGDPATLSKVLGFVLSQDSMMAIASDEFANSFESRALRINIGEKTSEEVAQIYDTLRAITIDGQQPIGGQSTSGGMMTILLDSDTDVEVLSTLVDSALNKQYDIAKHRVFAAFPEKEEYDYADPRSDPAGDEGVARQRARDARAQATTLLEKQLDRIEAGQAPRDDEAGTLRQSGLSLEEQSRLISEAAAGRLSQTDRGGFNPRDLSIVLTKDADYSTLHHETMHAIVEIYARIASQPNAPATIVQDFQTLMDFVGVANVEAWNAMTLEEQRPLHEAMASAHELWFFEGKAPSVELQPVFDRISAWMRKIYNYIATSINDLYKANYGKDLPILNDEVRSVFARMYASEQQVNQAEQVRNMVPMFQTQEQSGMDDATWQAYQELYQEAHDAAVTDLTKASLRNMRWLSNARSRVLKEMQKAADAQRKEVREQVTAEVENEPVYKAMRFLKRGELVLPDGTVQKADGDFKLSIAALEEMYMGEGDKFALLDWSGLGHGKYGMLAKQGLAPDLVATMFDFSSGDALVRALLEAKPINEEIKARTDARMEAEYGDMTDEREIQLKVEEALHNEARARFVAAELRFLNKSTQPVRVMMQAARQAARDILAGKPIREIRPRDYSLAEARAAKQTEKHMKKGEPALAAKSKQNQLVQNQLAAEAVKARQEVEKGVESFRKFFKSDEKMAKARNMDLVDAARAILASYGLGQSNKSPTDYIEKLRTYNPDLYAELEPLILEAAAGAKDYTQMTLTEFRLMREAVETLWFQSKREKEVMIEGKAMALELITDELNARLAAIGIPLKVAGEQAAPGTKDRAIRSFYEAKAATRRVEHWANATDGAKGVGPFTTYIWRPIRQALDAYREMRNVYTKRYVESIAKLDLPVAKIEARELGYTFGNGNGGIGKAELLGAILHTGNESNYRKLLLGRGWGSLREDGTLDDTNWRAFEARMINEGKLTKADYDWAQSVWDLNEELKPMAQKAHHDLYGYYFKEVESNTVSNALGVWRGGYVPAKTDPFIVRDAQKQAKMEELESDFRNAMPSTGMGFTKARVEYNKPLSLDIRVMAKHIDDVIRFVNVQPAVKDVVKILRNREFADNISRIDPSVIEDMLLPWLNRAARQITSEPGKHKAIDAFWRGVRSRTGISIMFANITNALQQVTGFFPAALKVKGRYIRSALASYVTSPTQSAEQVAELSPFMADRMQNQMIEIQDMMNDLVINPTKFDKVQKWATHHGYFLQQAFQNMVDTVTWMGTYNQTLAELEADVSDKQAVREAVQRADAAVRMTQSSLAAEDIAAFEVGTPFYKTFIQFSGYFNMLANLNADEYIKVFRDLGWRGNKGKLAMIYVLGFMLPMILSDAIVRTLGGAWDDEDDDGYLDEFMEWFFGSQFRGAVALVPGFGPGAAAVFNAFNDKPYDDRMATSPSISTLEGATVGVVKAGINVVSDDKEVTGKNVRDVLTLLSLVTGIPLTVLGRPIGYEMEVERGKIQPTDTMDYIRGLVTGKASEASKP